MSALWRGDCLKVESATPFEKWYFNDEKYRESAEKCKSLIDKLGDVRVYEIRPYEKHGLVCWFATFKDIAEDKLCYVLHFDIRRSDIYIYFRFVDYVQLSNLKEYSWLNRNKSIYTFFTLIMAKLSQSS
jgi:hypothetical protein